jgi:hypothetical protein
MDDLHAALLDGEETEEDDDEPVAEFSLGGVPVRVLETSQIDEKRQHLDVVYRALTQEDEELAALSMSHDYLTTHQLQSLIEDAGLAVLALRGDFEGAPLEEASQVILGAGHPL